MINNWLDIIQDKLFPPSCLFCGQSGFRGMDLCQNCFEELPLNENCCYRCAEPFASFSPVPRLCGRCISKPPSFEETIAPFLYHRAMRYLVTGLKFANQYKNARLLAMLMAEQIKTSVEIPDCLLPVPLHKRRYRERGFNQSIEIAKTLSKNLQIPLELSCCSRIRHTDQQMRLSAKQRRKNLKKAFSSRPLDFKHIAIVDDVMTTGSTVSQLALALKQAGAERVDIWVCARA